VLASKVVNKERLPDRAGHVGQRVSRKGIKKGSMQTRAVGRREGEVSDTREESSFNKSIEQERGLLALVTWVASAAHEQAHQRTGMKPAQHNCMMH
jgi:hypothetical protein